MAHRLSKIITRTGDSGKTRLANGDLIDKDDICVVVLGEIDELNSWIGLLRYELPTTYDVILKAIQQDLFNMGAEIALPGIKKLLSISLERLDQEATDLNKSLPPLKEFVLPFGNQSVCYAHISRSICRRAERSVVKLSKKVSINTLTLKYMNRLSDFLFILARCLSKSAHYSEELWNSQ